MALNLFLLGANDYTNNIINETYDVQKEDVYVSWTDGNFIDRREITRTRIVGKFTMRFRTLASYEAFVADLSSAKTSGGYYACTIWANNTVDSNSANLFISMSPVAHQKPNLVMDYQEFEVTVKEA